MVSLHLEMAHDVIESQTFLWSYRIINIIYTSSYIGSTGKSTIFKSIQYNTKDPKSEFNEEKFDALSTIRQNLVAAILVLLKKSQEIYDQYIVEEYVWLKWMIKNVSDIQLIVNYGSDSIDEYNEEMQQLGQAIYDCW